MDVVTRLDVREIVLMFSAQVGKTEMLLNIIGFLIEHEACPILSVQPTLEMAEAFSKDRLAPMLRDSFSLRDKVADPRSRDSGNTVLHKQFLGGHITLAGANSAASLASRPIRVVLADEVDRYPISAGTAKTGDGRFTGEGDPLALAEKRTATFWNRKIVKVSTPTIKDISRIEMAYKESDQRRYFVPCNHCGEFQILVWAQVVWSPAPPEEASYYCVHCGARWSESERQRAVRNGQWRSSQPFKGIAGFHLNALYSPWTKLGELAVEFVNAKGHPERLKTFINTALGEVWDEAHDAKDPQVLRDRAEDYNLGEAPAGALLITAAVDVQGDRLECYTWAYGEGEESWCIDFKAFYGDPIRPLVWDQLLEHLTKPIQHAEGALSVPRTVAIDSGGHHTQVVYSFCRRHATRRTENGLQQILAVKGQSIQSKAIMGKPTLQDIDLNGDKIARGVHLWPVGTHAAKQLIYARLNIDVPGKGYVHTTRALPEDFWDQLIAERLVTKFIRGYPTLEWNIAKGKRNEALDCAVYAYAAAIQLGLLRVRPIDWKRLREKMTVGRSPQPVRDSAEDESQPEPTPPEPPRPALRAPMHQHPGFARGGNWATRWRK
jgi:phage terminase large subunit GpA-like protein